MIKIKYPKFLLLIFTFIVAYIIFKERGVLPFHNFLLDLGYFGVFIAGIFFAYGFTAAPATAFFLILGKDLNIFLAAIIGGFGSLIGDFIIFKFIRSSFSDEIKKLSKEKMVKNLNNKMYHSIKRYFIPVLAGFIIASPLPDEIGVSLLAISMNVSIKIFAIISYLLNTAGILVILAIGSLI